MTNKNLTIGLLITLVIAIIGIFTPFVQSLTSSFGAVGGKLIEQYDPYVRYNGGINTALPFKTTSTTQFGTSGDQLTQANFGVCNIWAASNTIAASTTIQVDCGAGINGATSLTGVSYPSVVQLQAPTTTSQVSGGLRIMGVSASSTPGYITLILRNDTGGSFTWTAAASSSQQYEVVR